MGKLKLIFGGLIVTLVGVVIAGVAILKSTDFNQYKSQIAEQVEKATGRKLTIDGNLELAISLTPKVKVDGVTFANAAWGSRPEMVTVKSFAAQMELIPLLFGEINISELILIEPDILLETNKKGQANWELSIASEAETAPAADSNADTKSTSTLLPTINGVSIEKARFTYKDGLKGEQTSLIIDHMQATAEDSSSPLELLIKGSFNEHIISLTGSIGSPSKILQNESMSVNLEIEAINTIVKVSGNIAKPLDAKGINLALSAESDNISRLGELANVEVGKVGPFNLTATVSDGNNSYKIGGINLKIADTDLSGDASINLANKTPLITANLSSTYFNIKNVTPESAPANEQAAPVSTEPAAKGQKIFPQDPLPLEGLKAVNADITLKAETFVAANFTLDKLSKNIVLKNGNLVAKPAFSMGGGAFEGDIQLNAQNVPARLNITLKGKDLGLGDSLKKTGVTDLIEEGKTQLDVKLSSSGKSVADLMANLNGKTLVNVGEGRIKSSKVNFIGGDLIVGVLENILPSAKQGEFTPFTCAVVNLDFKNGVTEFNKRIAMQTNVMNVISSGKINLANETLDVGVNPEPRGDTADLGVNLGGLASVVRLTGPLSAPGVGLDAAGTAKAAVGIGAAIATGGVSLLVEGLTDKVLSDSNPCQTALGVQSTSSSTSEPTSTTTPTQEKSPANPVEGLINLFGGNK